MLNESGNNISPLRDELLDDVVGGVNPFDSIESNERNTVCAGCGADVGRKAYKYQGRSYCSRCFMQLKNKG